MTSLEQLADDWQLTLDKPLPASRAQVHRVRSVDNRPGVLKLAAPDGWHAGQVPALKAWRAEGVVEVLRAKPALGALLLEPLDAVWFDRDDEMAAIAGLWRRLHVPAPAALPRLSEVVAPVLDALAADPRGAGVPPRLAQQAVTAGGRLLAEAPRPVALHGALRAEHLAARPGGELVALAPLGLAGDADAEAFGVLDHFDGPANQPEDRFWALADALAASGVRADEHRMRDWTVVLAICLATRETAPARVTQLVSLAKAVASIRVESDW